MKLICANFKMHKLEKEIKDYLNIISKQKMKNVIYFPGNIYLKEFHDFNLTIGCQDISFLEQGALTGDTSLLQLKELGVTYTIIGHSERRKFYNDSKYVNQKLELALKNNLTAILCIGENYKEFQEKKTTEKLKKQLDEALKNNLNYLKNDNLIIAYEPIWSIGTNKIPTNNCLKETFSWIKNYLKTTYNLDLKVLYGGSVNLENITTLEKLNIIDGYLIGTACLDASSFLQLIAKIN